MWRQSDAAVRAAKRLNWLFASRLVWSLNSTDAQNFWTYRFLFFEKTLHRPVTSYSDFSAMSKTVTSHSVFFNNRCNNTTYRRCGALKSSTCAISNTQTNVVQKTRAQQQSLDKQKLRMISCRLLSRRNSIKTFLDMFSTKTVKHIKPTAQVDLIKRLRKRWC